MVASTRTNALDGFGILSRNNSASAILADAGADFSLRKESLSDWSGKPSLPGQHVVIREDTGTAIGMVGDNYQTLSNCEFFVPIADALVEETGAKIDRFAMLDGGARSIMRLSWDEDFRVGDAKVGDIVGRRAIITTSHDSKWAGKLILEALRLACSNGMTVPCGQNEFSLTHSRNGHRQLADIVRMVPKIEEYFRHFSLAAEIMADTRILATDKRAEAVVKKVMDPNKRAADNKSGDPNLAQERVNRVMDLFGGAQPGADNRAVRGTAWGLFNACSDYYNHGRANRGSDRASENRFRAMLPGKNGGAAARDIVKAYDVITKELKIDKAIAAAITN